ncbi:MAG: B12-binding domain-containing radical SAM protein, partial [Vulcanimicrobiaceae bacterium]
MRFAFIDNVLIERTEQGVEVELQPHLGLIALIAGLRAAGHEGVLYDPKIALARRELEAAPGFAAAVAERIAALEADAVGFTTLGSNFATTIRIAQALRPLRPALPIVLGGPHATILDREILERYPAFDAIVRGEADETIGAFAAALGGEGSLDDVPGVSYRAGGTVRRSPDAAAVADLDALPFAAYEAYPIAELGLGILAVDAGRGCPFHCSFCSTATFFGRRYRLKSAARLVCELDRLCAAYGVRRFVLNHDLFTVNKKKIREFCAAVAGRGYRWSCSARLDCVDDALLADMAAAGCTGIYYGIETGSARLQRVVEKNLDLALYHPRIGRSLELGMAVTASFITGYPQETREDQDRTLALLGETLERYDERLSPQLHLLAPEPGTALHARFAETLAYDGYRIDFVSPAIEHGDRELAASDPLTFVCHHYYAAGLARATHLAVVEGFTNLLQLPRVVLRELVRAYGPFADLVRDAGAFLSASVRLPPTQALAAFVDAALGPDRPVTDAV